MQIRVSTLLVSLALLAAHGNAWGASYCLAPGPTGKDTNAGTYSGAVPANPADQCWATVAHAVLRAGAGDTVCLMSGTWVAPVVFSQSGTASAPIVWKACPGSTPKINSRANVNESESIRVTGSYQTFQGLVSELVYGGETSTTFEDIWGISGDHVTLDGITVEGTNARGKELGGDYKFGEPGGWQQKDPVRAIIVRSGADYCEIKNSVVRHISKHAIVLMAGAFHARVANNKVYDVADRTLDIGACGTDICGTHPSYLIRGHLIESNFLCGVWREDIVQTNPDPRSLDLLPLSSPGAVIRNNVACDVNENGFDMKGGAKWLVEGNLVYGMAGGSIVMFGSRTRADEAIVRNNVVFDSGGGVAVFNDSSYYGNTNLHNRRRFAYPTSPPEAPSGCGINKPYPYPYSLADIFIYGNSRGEVINSVAANALFAITLDSYDARARIDGNVYWNDIEGAVRFSSKIASELRGVDFAAWKAKLAEKSIPGGDIHSVELEKTSDYFAAPTGLAAICCPYCIGTVDGSDPANYWDDRLLTWHQQFDFSPRESFRNSGVDLTTTVGSGTNTQLKVASADGFYDGTWAPAYTQGDLIVIGDLATGAQARVKGRNLQTNVLTLDRSVTWTPNQGVNVIYSQDGNSQPTSTSKNQGSFHHVAGTGVSPNRPQPPANLRIQRD